MIWYLYNYNNCIYLFIYLVSLAMGLYSHMGLEQSIFSFNNTSKNVCSDIKLFFSFQFACCQDATASDHDDLCWFRSEIHFAKTAALIHFQQTLQIGHTSLARAYARDMICVCKRGLLGVRCTPLTPGTEHCLSPHSFQSAYFTFTVCQKSRDCILII